MRLSVFCGILLLIFLSACDNADTEAPTLDILEPLALSAHLSGSDLPIRIQCRDNDNLSTIQVQLLGDLRPDNPFYEAPLETTLEFDVLGQDADLQTIFALDNDLPSGTYQLSAWCTDARGNTSKTEVVEFFIQSVFDQLPPAIEITFPDISNLVQIFAGNGFTVFGNITDDNGLAEISFELIRTSDGSVIQDNQITPESNTYEIVESFTPINETGFYQLKILAKDTFNNSTELTFGIEII